MRKGMEESVGKCPDCGSVAELNTLGICHRCNTRRQNMKARGKVYVPYIDLSEKEKLRVCNIRAGQQKWKELDPPSVIESVTKPVTFTETKKKEVLPKQDINTEHNRFINILKDCGCTIPDDTMNELLSTLDSTNKLKDILVNIAGDKIQEALLDLEQMLNVAERKLQHDWEYNGFNAEDDIKFKTFLTWRRTLKSAIFFWKKLYSTNTLVELKKAWDAYAADPSNKQLIGDDRPTSILKRYQITTESISTIMNTRKLFTRVMYATSEEDAVEKLVKWLSDRQLHLDKNKTKVVELSSK